MQQLRHRTVKKDGGEANSVLRRHSCRKWPAIGILLAGIAGVPGFGAQAQEKTQPTEKTRTVMVCPSKDAPIESCKRHVCEKTKEGKEEKCVPASGEETRIIGLNKEGKEIGLLGTLGAVFVIFAGLVSIITMDVHRRKLREQSKQESENAGA